MRKKNRTTAIALLLAAGIAAAGCGTDSSDGKSAGQNEQTQDGGESAARTDGGDSSTAEQNGESAAGMDAGGSKASDQNDGPEEKTEIRREDYPDCDGSGHGYVEIYYSDGSVETEEY